MRAANCETRTLALVLASVAAEDLSPCAAIGCCACGVAPSLVAPRLCSRPSSSSAIVVLLTVLVRVVAVRGLRNEITDGAIVFVKISLRDTLRVRHRNERDVRGVITIEAPVG